MFGRQLLSAVRAVGIDTCGAVTDPEVNTTLAFVKKLPDGDRDFSFYRSPGADMRLSAEDIKPELISESRVFHFGTLSMTHPGCREATETALRLARESGCVISFDPNLRPPLWKNAADMRETALFGIRRCDVLKIADNEVEELFGSTDYERAARDLATEYGIALVLVSLGDKGSLAASGEECVFAPAFRVQSIENTGAGDCFMACALDFVLKNGLRRYTREELSSMLRLANAAAAIVTTRRGALAVMPTEEEIAALMNSR